MTSVGLDQTQLMAPHYDRHTAVCSQGMEGDGGIHANKGDMKPIWHLCKSLGISSGVKGAAFYVQKGITDMSTMSSGINIEIHDTPIKDRQLLAQRHLRFCPFFKD